MTSDHRQTLLCATELRVRRGRTDVLHGVDLAIEPGEVVAVIGPNGAGKSTLLRVLAGLLKPSGGMVERNGSVATALQSPDLARRSSRANVELALAWWGVARGQRRARADDALEAMRATHLAHRPAVSMSGGEQRRVHLARAVSVRPDVLLLDEPFAGLDPVTRAALLDDTSSALRTHAGAVVVVVHDRAEAWALADRLVVMLDGRIATEGRPRDVLESPPTPTVAQFLGFNGELRDNAGVLLTRPSQVRIDPAGDLSARVTRIVPLEDGARVELETARGTVWAVAGYPVPELGAQVRLQIAGGARFTTP